MIIYVGNFHILPGGRKLLEAAGGALEPFWKTYPIHRMGSVSKILEGLRIGNVHEDDLEERRKEVSNLIKKPTIDTATFTVDVMIEGESGLVMSIENLKNNFVAHSAVVTSKCTDGSASEITATWTGALLSDILTSSGVPSSDTDHIILQSLDTNSKGAFFQTTIPAKDAFDPSSGILLAYNMDGEAMPLDHGFPLRAIIPEAPRSQQIKMLKRIIVVKPPA